MTKQFNTEHWRQVLEVEKLKLEAELKDVGRINPDNTSDWEPIAADLNIDTAEDEERAAEITSFEDRSAVEFEIEKRWNEVGAALLAIENGTYGICKVCKTAIEDARLEVNPAASTCMAHME